MDIADMVNEVVAALTEKRGEPDLVCSTCGGSTWRAGPGIAHLPFSQGLALGFDGNTQIVPMFLLSCSNCGETKVYNLNTLGLYQKWASKEQLQIARAMPANLPTNGQR